MTVHAQGDDWAGKVITWNYRQERYTSGPTSFELPAVRKDSVELRDGLVPGDMDEGPSYDDLARPNITSRLVLADENPTQRHLDGGENSKVELAGKRIQHLNPDDSSVELLLARPEPPDVALAASGPQDSAIQETGTLGRPQPIRPSNSQPSVTIATRTRASLMENPIPSPDMHQQSNVSEKLRMPTVPVEWVSPRKTRRMRLTNIHATWFQSFADRPIDHPPELALDSGIEVGDVYMHTSRDITQTWRCIGVDPVISWATLQEGDELAFSDEHNHDQSPRKFVISDNGQPGWVLPETVVRLYKDKKDVAGKKKKR